MLSQLVSTQIKNNRDEQKGDSLASPMLTAPLAASGTTADANPVLNSPGKLSGSRQQEVSEAPAALAKKTGTAEGLFSSSRARSHLTVSVFLAALCKLPLRGPAHRPAPSRMSWPSFEPPVAVRVSRMLSRSDSRQTSSQEYGPVFPLAAPCQHSAAPHKERARRRRCIVSTSFPVD